ncbi:hypothetical protein BDW74DRAFT_180218 [Aspergillus multicolor]|uniref:uncharacterized protein n=1 Tax=Aspergillus multicolor TaxID=41759 RepID=UPI003CCD7945
MVQAQKAFPMTSLRPRVRHHPGHVKRQVSLDENLLFTPAMSRMGSGSGLQVLGVVIGGLPMIINSVYASKPYYPELSKTLDELIETLKSQHFLMRKDLENILSAQVSSLGHGLIAEILHQPHAIYFRDPEVIKAVERALGDGRDVYVSTLRKCGDVIFEIAERLAGFPSSSKGSKGTPKGLGRALMGRQKISSAGQRREFDRLLQRLDYSTVLLARLRLTIKPEPSQAAGDLTRSVSRATRVTMNLNTNVNANTDNVSQAASRLYAAIAAGFDEECHPMHTAALFLQTGTELLWKGQDSGAAREPVVLTVGFRLPSVVKGYCTVEVKAIHDAKGQPPPGPSSGAVTGDLCTLVTSASDSSRMLEMRISDVAGGNLIWNELHPALTKPSATLTSDLTTLHTIIQNSTPGTWSTPQRLRLSFLLASSILQLSPTPWLPTSHPLTSEGIWFTKDNAATLTKAGSRPSTSTSSQTGVQPGTSGGAGLFAPKPLILRDFFNGDTSPRQIPFARSSLLNLTILLLEIWHQRTFAWYCTEIQMPLQLDTDADFWGRARIAEMWVEDSRGLVDSSVWEVMVRCVNGTFGTAVDWPVARWDDVVFRGEFWERVVLVLGERLEAG